ncbi:MAG TPA: TetR family transcriptional regulator [Acidimicrobiales bacterium]|nr:TetR family transcriptional regulator [Acidimicrobiales bacterium]
MTAPARRSPEGEHRQRDAERTKQALIDSALIEFATKGFRGARVNEIAARAGVNKQLISYYFGGKDGLYQAIGERWLREEARFAPPDMSLEDMAVAYLRLDDPTRDMVRLFLREGLDNPRGDTVPDADPDAVPPEIVDLRRRQVAGEVDPAFDPRYLLLMLMVLSTTDVAIPHQVKKFTGLDPTSREFRERYGEQLRLLLRHLRPPDSAPPAPK